MQLLQLKQKSQEYIRARQLYKVGWTQSELMQCKTQLRQTTQKWTEAEKQIGEKSVKTFFQITLPT